MSDPSQDEKIIQLMSMVGMETADPSVVASILETHNWDVQAAASALIDDSSGPVPSSDPVGGPQEPPRMERLLSPGPGLGGGGLMGLSGDVDADLARMLAQEEHVQQGNEFLFPHSGPDGNREALLPPNDGRQFRPPFEFAHPGSPPSDPANQFPSNREDSLLAEAIEQSYRDNRTHLREDEELLAAIQASLQNATPAHPPHTGSPPPLMPLKAGSASGAGLAPPVGDQHAPLPPPMSRGSSEKSSVSRGKLRDQATKAPPPAPGLTGSSRPTCDDPIRIDARLPEERARRVDQRLAWLNAQEPLPDEELARRAREEQERLMRELKASKERERLRIEQQAEFEHALLMDRQREEEEANQMRLKREDEKKRKEKVERRASEVATKRARLPPEPERGSDSRLVMVKRLDGSRVKRSFPKAAAISALYDWLDVLDFEASEQKKKEGGGAGDPAEGADELPEAVGPYKLVSTLPRKEYRKSEESLEEVGIENAMMLLVEKD